MKVTYLFGILVASALSIGCVAQAGTDDPTGSSGEDLSATSAVAVEQRQEQALTPQARLLRSPRLTQAHQAQPLQQIQNVQGLAGTDPGAPVQDDGDGREPDPHPWHMDTTVVAAH
jgi:hypothetical protein